MNARKRIAVLIAQPNAAYQKYLLQGILQEAFTYDMDVLVFSSFVKTGDILCTDGEKKIYDLINYEKVDAVIVVPDTIQITGVLTQIMTKLKTNFHGPVLVVDTESSEFPFIHNDDTMDIKRMIDHLIDVHGYRSIAFMTGPKEHLHSQWRLKGYLDSLKEHGISAEERLIFYGDFWYREGMGVVEKVLLMNPRPQAIACGSQVMAISVYDALRKHGVKIPEEMAVLGYDPNGAEVESNYHITTVMRSSKELGIRAARNIIERLSGRKIETEKIKKQYISFNNSCGCPCQTQEKEMFWTDQYVGNDINELSDTFYSIYNYMLEDIIEPKELIQGFYRVMYYTKYIKGFSTFHICLNQDWVDRSQNAPDYTENMLCVLGLQENSTNEPIVALDHKFPRENMLPILDEVREKPSVFYFTPIHFCGVDFGYSVISYENEAKVYPKCYSEWIRKLENGLESQRRQCRLQRMYELMRENAVKDLLTSVYSRNGFNLYGTELFEEAKSSGRKLLVIVGDVNDTKYVNDTFGHMEGDAAIKIIAEAFMSQLDQSVEHGKVFRIGGDEFVLMVIGEYTEEQIANKLCGIRKATDVFIQNKQKPYELSTSLGTYYGTIQPQDELNKIIALADAKMYFSKNIHRKGMRSKLTEIQQNYDTGEV